MKGQSNPGNILVTTFVVIVTVYVAYQLIKGFSEDDPTFGKYGWTILGALVIGVIAFFKSGRLFR